MDIALQAKDSIDEHIYQETEESDKWNLGEYIPDTWKDEQGITRVTVYMPDSDYEMVKVGDEWRLRARISF